MASPKAKPQKRLSEFLKEQQDPFILDLYLLERGNSANGNSGKSLEKWAINKKRPSLFPYSKLLTSLHKKLVFHSHSCIVIRDSDIVDEHVDVSVPPEAETTDHTIEDTYRFSFSTVYLSCSDTEEDVTSLSPHKDRALFSPTNTSQASNTGVLQRYT